MDKFGIIDNLSVKSYSATQKLNSFLRMQTVILDCQSKNKNFFIGRQAGMEEDFVRDFLGGRNPNREIVVNTGIKFNSKDDIIKYCDLYKQASINCDLLAVWANYPPLAVSSLKQNDIINTINNKKICAQALEPFYFMDSNEYKFDEVFKNKKVLIITSHTESTKKQLSNLNNIFKKRIFHETTKFHVYKPPQQNAGSHDNNSWWFHFDKMTNDIRNIKKDFDFDIALVSCGGFGTITCDFIYTELNSSSIYVGGGLQNFFGIKGKRWISHPIISKFMNSNWINVLDIDKPKNPKSVEGGCYW